MKNKPDLEPLVPVVLRMAKGFSKSDDEYESVALSALVDVVREWDEELHGALEAYVRVGVRNRLRGYYRRKRWERERGLSGGAPDMSQMRARPGWSLHDLIAALPWPIGHVAQLRLVEERSWKSIERATGLSVRQVKEYVVLAAAIMLRRIDGQEAH